MIDEKKPDFEFLDGLIKELREQTEGLIGLPEEEKSEDIFLEKNPESLKSRHKSYRKNLNKKELFEKDNLNVPLSAFSNSSNSLLPNFPAEPFSKLFNISGLIDKDLNDKTLNDKTLIGGASQDKYSDAQGDLPLLPDLPPFSSENSDKTSDKIFSKSFDKTSEETSDVKEKKIKEFFDISKKINLYHRDKKENNFYQDIKNDVSSGFEEKEVSGFENEDENLDENIDENMAENMDEEKCGNKDEINKVDKYDKEYRDESWEENGEEGKNDDGRFHKEYSVKTKIKPVCQEMKNNNNEFLSYSKFQNISQTLYGINSLVKSSKLFSLNKNYINESEKISSEKMPHEIEIIQENLLKINSSLFKTLS